MSCHGRRRSWALLGALLGVWGAGCGGSVGAPDPTLLDADAGAGGSGGTGASGGTGGLPLPLRDAGVDPRPTRDAAPPPAPDDGGVDARPFDDPGCPDAKPPPLMLDCDPFTTPSGCGRGEACDPYVRYPPGRCQQEQYGTRCIPAGLGEQGDPCNQGCADGYNCIVGVAGVYCAKLCPLTGDSGCPRGLLCDPLDVSGFGVCT